jgi:hypothetical protein
METECNLCGERVCSSHTFETPLEDVPKDIIDKAVGSVFREGYEIKADEYGDIHVCEQCYNTVQKVCPACKKHRAITFVDCLKCSSRVCETCSGAKACWNCVKRDDVPFQDFLVQRLKVETFRDVLIEYEKGWA